MEAMLDRGLIALVIDRTMKQHGEIRGIKSRLAQQAKITRSTLDATLDPERWDRVSARTMHSIEIGLDLPPDALHYIGMHDWQSLAEDGMEPDLIAWAQRHTNPDDGNPGAGRAV